MKPSLGLRVSQHLALTPQLQQSIRLLQLSTLDLEQEVEQTLLENPLLEREDESDAPQAPAKAADDWEHAPETSASIATHLEAEDRDSASDGGDFDASDWQATDWSGDGSLAWTDEADWGDEAPARGANAPEPEGTESAINLTTAHASLADALRAQAAGLRASPEERAALDVLIDSLDEDGYLADSLEDIAAALCGSANAEQLPEMIACLRVALALLQSLAPAGVGARSLGECLRLQLLALPDTSLPCAAAALPPDALRDLALRLVDDALPLLARHDLRRLALAGECTPDQARAVLSLVTRLEPKPGRAWVDLRQAPVVPDVLVLRLGRSHNPHFDVQLNPEVMPRLRVNALYAQALRGARQSEGGHAALQQRLQEARWFIKNIQQRFDTILRVSRAIVTRQHAFFVHGELAMRPLVLRDIADELGLHESTISRVTNGKFMATPHGTFELKYFFGSGLGTDAGGNASSTAVRALIRQFIGAEDAKNPLSDQQLADLLKEQGIACARRTVAKYREGLRIPIASLRKAV